MGRCYSDRGRALRANSSGQQIYSQLEGDEIRTLLLAPGKKHGTVVCELEVIAKTSSHQYEALSYVWGDSRSRTSIECNGVSIQVTESLYEALLHLRYPSSWRRLWVDQLCIDQGQSHELMSQVRHMGNIYSNASRVVVWLGKRDSRLAGAWQLIKETTLSSSLVRSDFLETSSPTSTPTKRPSSIRSGSSGSRSSLRSSMSRSTDSFTSTDSLRTPIKKRSRRSEAGSNSPILKKALAIFQHEWFTRKWTFQEIVMSKAAIVCCGDIEMAWSDLTAWYFHYAAKPRSSTLLYDSMGSFENVMTVRSELDKQHNGSSDGIKLAELLMLTRQRNSLKAEDTIYALLGLHGGFSRYLKDITDEEGWLPVPELFLTTFRYCLEVEKDMSVLSAAGLYNGNKSYHLWASWLPDWRAQLPLRPLTISARHSSNSRYDVSDKSELVFQIAEDDGYFTMHVKGFCVGVVATRAESWPNTYFIAGEEAQAILDLGIPNVHAQPISALNVSQDMRDESAFSTKILSSSMDRDEICEPIRTSASVRAGDLVCVLLGGPVLYILRSVNEPEPEKMAIDQDVDKLQSKSSSRSVRCRFVGECAVSSLMDRALRQKLPNSTMIEFCLV